MEIYDYSKNKDYIRKTQIFKISFGFNMRGIIQGYLQRMRLQKRLCGFCTYFFLLISHCLKTTIKAEDLI